MEGEVTLRLYPAVFSGRLEALLAKMGELHSQRIDAEGRTCLSRLAHFTTAAIL